MNELITAEMLKEWQACDDGFAKFCELFPNGADLQTAMDGLIACGRDDWSYWLFCRCRDNNLFNEIVKNGYRNSGSRNSGDGNSGDWNSGNQNSGDWNSGDWNSGNQNSGDENSGYRNSGYRNSGDWNSGDENSGSRNSGYRNSGYRNSGDWNSGNQNSGNENSGSRNSGDENSGGWNSGDQNSGFFNSITPTEILIFNRLCSREEWLNADKPSFLFFDIAYWVSEDEMTDEEKKADPNFYVRGGQLRKRDYKEAFKLSWNNADAEDRIKVKNLPNFDAEVFFEISGIDLR